MRRGKREPMNWNGICQECGEKILKSAHSPEGAKSHSEECSYFLPEATITITLKAIRYPEEDPRMACLITIHGQSGDVEYTEECTEGLPHDEIYHGGRQSLISCSWGTWSRILVDHFLAKLCESYPLIGSLEQQKKDREIEVLEAKLAKLKN